MVFLVVVYMAYYGSDNYVDILPQELSAPEREGFTLTEWGGTEVRSGSQINIMQ